MEQRPLRLGDIVDDYCPRERHITNHAVVVMSGDDVQQTRCTACDAEHPYKHAKAPLRKRRDENSALYDEVLAGVLKPKQVVQDAQDMQETPGAQDVRDAQGVQDVPDVKVESIAPPEPEPEPEPVAAAWGNRPLIRAQLPRIEGQLPVVQRSVPEFTIRQQGSRGYGQPSSSNGWRRGPGQGSNNQHQGHGSNGQGGGQGRGGRDQGRSQGRPRHSR
jgi:hypothetical protein